MSQGGSESPTVSSESSQQSTSSATPPSQPTPLLRQPSTVEYDVLSCLQGSAKLIERVIARQVKADAENLLDLPPNDDPRSEDPIVAVLGKLVQSFKLGSGSEDVKAEVTRLLNGRDEKAELVNSLLVAHDMDRLPDYLRLRRFMEKYLLHSAFNGNLTPAEALAFLKISQDEIRGIVSQVKSAGDPSKDVDDLLNKADFVNKASQQELMDKFKQTSPQGREILRKIGYKLSKAAAAKG